MEGNAVTEGSAETEGSAAVFCFTATGNSLYVARQLGDDVRSIPHELGKRERRYKAESVGIVSPVFYHELPDPVKEFIAGSTFECDYFFIVGTYGAHHGGFAELTRQFLESCGHAADYVNTIIMVDNALPGYDIAEQLRIDPAKRVDEHIASLRADVRARRRYVQPATEEELAHHFATIAKGKIAPTDDDPLYKVSKACVGCGACLKVCPMNCIDIVGGRARHRYASCAVCMACIHACPQKAIEFASLAEKNPGVHYRNPHVTLADLISLNG